jgi:hypothetical protein
MAFISGGVDVTAHFGRRRYKTVPPQAIPCSAPRPKEMSLAAANFEVEYD